MYILGDIGNTETKLCIVSKNNKILKKITFLSKSVYNKQLNILFKKNKIQLNKIEKILFCSVVPKTFSIINKFLSKKFKLSFVVVSLTISIEPIFFKYQPNNGIFKSSFLRIKMGYCKGAWSINVSSKD